jgi:hypothetical protein
LRQTPAGYLSSDSIQFCHYQVSDPTGWGLRPQDCPPHPTLDVSGKPSSFYLCFWSIWYKWVPITSSLSSINLLEWSIEVKEALVLNGSL